MSDVAAFYVLCVRFFPVQGSITV